MSPGQIRNLGLSHVPEDRLATGVSREADIADNLLMGKHKNAEFAKFRFHQNKKAIRDYASHIFEKFDIRAAGVDTKVGSLSGGNMQKVVIAREFSFDSDVYIIAQPTRGVDIGAKKEIYNVINEMAAKGVAVIMVSSELPEVLGMSDRIMVVHEGHITGIIDAEGADQAKVMTLATGGVLA